MHHEKERLNKLGEMAAGIQTGKPGCQRNSKCVKVIETAGRSSDHNIDPYRTGRLTVRINAVNRIVFEFRLDES